MKDKFYLLAWGMQQRQSIMRRCYILEAVQDLKRKFRKVLYRYQDKRAERNFLELKSLIENFESSIFSAFQNGMIKLNNLNA